ncbi:MAG: FAD-dependent oxidoreductase [Candidatus Coatesbacteria bacterium]
MSERFDCIVAGGGLAGLTAAYTMAKAGLKVAVIERGTSPGAKNVMGGVLYRQPTELIFPEFWKSAPVERPVAQQSLWVLGKKGALELGVKNPARTAPPYNAFTVLRAKFDKWLGRQVVDAGALIIPETVATDVILENGAIVGVRTDREDGDLYASAVIAADGVYSQIAWKAGLRREWRPDQVSLAVKEVIALPAERIEDRFHLSDGAGATIELVGDATMGMMGIAFIYTNKDSLSVGVGVMLADLVKHRRNPNDVLENLKAHKVIQPLLAGGVVREYVAHMIPEGGYESIPKLFANGLLVAGDAAQLVNSFHREGSNLAMHSGRLAAETIIEAAKRGDFSATALSRYRDRLDDSFVMKDMKQYAGIGSYLEHRPHYFGVYPDLVNDVLFEFFAIDSIPKREKLRIMFRKALESRSLFGMLRDGVGLIMRLLLKSV